MLPSGWTDLKKSQKFGRGERSYHNVPNWFQQSRRLTDCKLFVYRNVHVQTHPQHKAYHPTPR